MSHELGEISELDEMSILYSILSELNNGDGSSKPMNIIKPIIREKTGLEVSDEVLDSLINTYVYEEIFNRTQPNDSGFLTLGPESSEYFQPSVLGLVWQNLRPEIRDSFVYDETSNVYRLNDNPLWRLITSPTGKAWVKYEEFIKFNYFMEGELIELRLLKNKILNYKYKLNKHVINELNISEYLKKRLITDNETKVSKDQLLSNIDNYLISNYNISNIRTNDYISQRALEIRDASDGCFCTKEYLIEWSSEYVNLIANTLKDNNIYNIPSYSLNIPESDILLLSNLIEPSFQSYKLEQLKKLEKRLEETLNDKDPEDQDENILKIDELKKSINSLRDRDSAIIYGEKCPIGLNKCKGEWRINDGLDKYLYTDVLNEGVPAARLYLSSLYPGCYISFNKSEISLPMTFLYEILENINDVYDSTKINYRPRTGNNLTTYKKVDSERVIFNISERNMHPPDSVEYYLSRVTLNKIFPKTNNKRKYI